MEQLKTASAARTTPFPLPYPPFPHDPFLPRICHFFSIYGSPPPILVPQVIILSERFHSFISASCMVEIFVNVYTSKV